MALYDPFIDRTYFTGYYTVGQAESDIVSAELDLYIRKHEYDFLTLLMGKSFYELFHAGTQGPDPDARWQRLAYGISFYLDESKVKTGYEIDSLGNRIRIPYFRYFDKQNINYKGLLKRANSTTNIEFVNDGYGAASPIAKYIYYYWHSGHYTRSGGAGESVQQVHNGIMVSPNDKMVRGWNEMCCQVFEFYLFIDQFIADYPEWDLDVNARFNPKLINTLNVL